MNKQKLIELRCKAWGITEDEYFCNQCSDFSLEDMARAYRRGKNKGASDTAIQNGRFYQKQMQDIYDKKNKQIAELKAENEQIKNSDTLCKLIGEQKRKITDLEAQIEKMKCCGNCSHFKLDSSGLYPINVCELTYPNRCKDHDKWEIEK